jgi:hypothetical protein
MAVHYFWQDEQKSILCIRFEGKWTWEELYVAQDALTDEMKKSSHPIDLILYSPIALNHVPPNALSHVPILMRRLTGTARLIVVSTPSPIWHSLNKLLSLVSGQYSLKVQMSKTFDEALCKLNAFRKEHD